MVLLWCCCWSSYGVAAGRLVVSKMVFLWCCCSIGKSETYSSESAMENGVQSVKTNAPDAAVVDNT